MPTASGRLRVLRAMNPFVVWVDVHLWPGSQAEFRKLVERHARASLAGERGCRRFDVVEPDGRPHGVFLYQVFADRAAYDAHLASDHHRDFSVASEPLCASMTVTTGLLVTEGGA